MFALPTVILAQTKPDSVITVGQAIEQIQSRVDKPISISTNKLDVRMVQLQAELQAEVANRDKAIADRDAAIQRISASEQRINLLSVALQAFNMVKQDTTLLKK
jgi:hypothetical protein